MPRKAGKQPGKSRAKQETERILPQQDSLLQFPPEIIYIIVSFLPGPFPVPITSSYWHPSPDSAAKLLQTQYTLRSNTLFTLSRVSRALRKIVLPIAFERFEVVRYSEKRLLLWSEEEDTTYIQEATHRLLAQIDLYTTWNPVMAGYVR